MSNLNFNAVLRQTEISRSNRDFLCTEEHGFFCVRRREVAFDDRPIQFSGRNGLVDCIMRIVHRADRCSRLIGVNVRCRVVFVVNLDLALQVFRNHQFNRVHSAVIFESFCVVPVLNIVNRNCGLMDGHTNVERKLGIVLAVSRDKLCRFRTAQVCRRKRSGRRRLRSDLPIRSGRRPAFCLHHRQRLPCRR